MSKTRVDEVDRYYRPIAEGERIRAMAFWIIAALSLAMPYLQALGSSILEAGLTSLFVALGLSYFVLSQILRFYLIPRAEHKRRQALLSDAFGAPLTHEQTHLYYNNSYGPSVQRLGASTMENAFFSMSIAAAVLRIRRFVVAAYLLAWLIAFTVRHNNLEFLVWITQVVFSAELLAHWLTLEALRSRHERTYEQLHAHFLHGVGDRTAQGIATILDAFVSYEVTKAAAGIQLSSEVFHRLNPRLSAEWHQIRTQLRMDLPDP